MFHDRLREARAKAGLTQEQVAGLLGIAKSTYSGYETGKSEPPMSAIANLMRFYSVSADWLWQDEMAGQFENEYPVIYEQERKQLWSVEGEDEIALLKNYRSLNASGRKQALKLIEMCANDQDYKKSDVALSAM